MQTIQDGQCGLYAHFGEHHADAPELLQLRTRREASERYVDDCGHPRHASLHLRVTAASGCDAFAPVAP